MPIYPGPAGSNVFSGPYLPNSTALTPGDLPTTLIVPADGAGAALVGKASAAVALTPPPGLVEQQTISVSGFFDGAPGVFEIDWQEADVDADGQYVANATVINAVNANNAFHAIITTKSKFGRAFVKTLPNNVHLTLTVEC